MKEHLTAEELERISTNRFEGAGLFDALAHLEKCEKCRSQIKLPTKEEILSRIFDEEPPPPPPSAATKSKSKPSSTKDQSSTSLKKRKSAAGKMLDKVNALCARHD